MEELAIYEVDGNCIYSNFNVSSFMKNHFFALLPLTEMPYGLKVVHLCICSNYYLFNQLY